MMAGVDPLYVGAVPFLNGAILLGWVEERSAAPLNLFVVAGLHGTGLGYFSARPGRATDPSPGDAHPPAARARSGAIT